MGGGEIRESLRWGFLKESYTGHKVLFCLMDCGLVEGCEEWHSVVF